MAKNILQKHPPVLLVILSLLVEVYNNTFENIFQKITSG